MRRAQAGARRGAKRYAPMQRKVSLREKVSLRFSFLVAAAVAGCGAAQSGFVSPSAMSQASAWMANGVKAHDLIYASNADGTVSVFRYWQHTLVGVLTNFAQPLGECADPAGDVYIVDYQRSKIYEYAHGGTKPIKVLDDASNNPYACAIEPSTANLAVANSPYNSSQSGNVAIYRHASGNPTYLQGGRGSEFTGCAYDDRGDLLVLSGYQYSPFWYNQVYYLPKGSKQLMPMNLPGLDSYSSHRDVIVGLAWDGKYWVAGPYYNYINLYTINVKASLVGTVKLVPASDYAGPVAIYRKSLKSRGTQLVAGVGASDIDYWEYPTGGTPIAQISTDLDSPFGVAISLKTVPK